MTTLRRVRLQHDETTASRRTQRDATWTEGLFWTLTLLGAVVIFTGTYMIGQALLFK